ncbi:MAG TPA: GDSL-type esterase/lipase family protein [Bacteroidales bacterium]|nr:GDSL-type esterase/lipase family protein [Bacteroidales bacterium]HOK98080.1 GDSL-type esterase/lipase family protein [Bacteroidales bacterium]HPO64699.1 GDSL-type esterase/lipase family protein [Bacteroidales bacterium]
MLKKITFTLILILVPFVFLLLIELGLRWGGYGYDLSLFVPSKQYKGYYEVNPAVTKRFFTHNNPTSPGNDLFLMQKPANAYRIFVMGSSTTRGFPYDMNVSFSRVLYYRLKDLFPNRQIEVVNVAMAAINSYALADYIDEILRQQPDAILIYAGHNEYYGAMGISSFEWGGNIRWIKKTHLALVHLRTYQLLQQAILGIMLGKQKPTTATLMQRMAHQKSIPYGSQQYYSGIKQFRQNIDEVLAKAKKQNVPVIISELVSNVRSLPPFQSEAYQNYPLASAVYREAQLAEQNGDYNKAKQLYYQAKDLDVIRFRAPEDINTAIHELAQKWKVPVVPMISIFESYCKHGIIGDELILEHLHPNERGYFLIADAFLHAMKEQKIIASQWDTSKMKPFDAYLKNWGYTVLDSLAADKSIKALMAGWPFQPDTVVNTFLYTYHAKSLEDSLALLSVKYDNLSLTQMHQELARNYEKNGAFEKAFREYLALVYTHPYNLNYYVEGLRLADLVKSDTLAYILLKDMPMLDSSTFALMRLGKIHMKNKDYSAALGYFKRAHAIAKSDNDRIYALEAIYFAYMGMDKKSEAKRILFEIREINPNYKVSSGDKKDVVVVVDPRVKPLIEDAIRKARQGQLKEAAELLQQSLQIQETAFACQMLGSVLFQLNDPGAFSMLERAYALNPNDENTINNLVVLSVMQKNYQKARFYLEKYQAVGQPEQYANLQAMVKKAFSTQKH